MRSLERLYQHLAARYDGIPDPEREALIAGLIQEEFEQEVGDALRAFRLNPEAAALPIVTASANIKSFTKDPSGVQFSDVAMRGAGAWVAQFTVTIDAVIDLTLFAGDSTVVEKPLLAAGRLEIDSQGAVVWLFVASIDALPDDPMRGAWIQLSERSPGAAAALTQYRMAKWDEQIADLSRRAAQSLSLPGAAEIYDRMTEEQKTAWAETMARFNQRAAESLNFPRLNTAEIYRRAFEGQPSAVADIMARFSRQWADSVNFPSFNFTDVYRKAIEGKTLSEPPEQADDGRTSSQEQAEAGNDEPSSD